MATAFLQAQKKYVVVTNTSGRPTVGSTNTLYYITDANKLQYWDGSSYKNLPYVNEAKIINPSDYTDKIYGTDASGNDILYDVSSMGVSKFTQLTDTPGNYGVSGQILFTNGSGIDYETVTISHNNPVKITGSFPTLTFDVKYDDTTIGVDGNGDLYLKDGSVTTAKIVNSAVTLAKLQNIPSNTIIGNNTATSDHPIALTVSDVKAMLGITSAMTYKGSVTDISSLFALTGMDVGDVWNVVNGGNVDSGAGNKTNLPDNTIVPAGHNFAWSGTEWDDLGSIVDLSGYLQKNTTVDTVYGVDSSGNQVMYHIGTSSGDIVERGSGGNITVPTTPSSSTDATSKSYVDSKIAATKVEHWSIDLMQDKKLTFQPSVKIKMDTTNASEMSGAPTPTLTVKVNGSPYTSNSNINVGDDVEVSCNKLSYWNIKVTEV